MNTDLLPRLFKVGGAAFTLIVFMISVISCQMIAPTDTIREDITIEEAQSLVSFPICVPTYIPSDIDPNPQIIYHADSINVPQETYIQLRYKQIDDQEKSFEIYQRFTNDEGLRIKYTDSQLESVIGGATVNLVDWISPRFPSTSKRNEAIERVESQASVYQTDQIVWWLYEITDPSEYRSNMTEWIIDHVEYSILSHLPAEETKKITLSMFACSKPK